MNLVLGIIMMSVISLPAEGDVRTVTAARGTVSREVLITEGDHITLACNTNLQWIFCLWDSPQKGSV